MEIASLILGIISVAFAFNTISKLVGWLCAIMAGIGFVLGMKAKSNRFKGVNLILSILGFVMGLVWAIDGI